MRDDRSWVDKSTILRVEVGSGVHGIATAGTDDRDEMGVALEPFRFGFGVVSTFEQHIYRSAAAREGKSDAPSEPGDLDLTIYSLRKTVRLLLQGNPSMLVILFAPKEAVISADARGRQLRDMAPMFASRQAGGRFLGYLQSQRQRLLGERGQKNVNRRDLVEKFGYDTKYAGHMLRLGYQGVEFMETGRFTLPMTEPQRSRVVAVRRGDVDLNSVLTEVGQLEVKLQDLRTTSPLPDEPAIDDVEEWMLDMYLNHWKGTWEHSGILKWPR